MEYRQAQRHKVEKVRRFCRTPYQSIGAQSSTFLSVPKKTLLFTICILFFLCNNTFVNAEALPFKDGGKLEFSLRWMGIIGGKSTIEFKRESLSNPEKNSYILNATLRTVGLADIVFRIRDEFSSLIIFNSKGVLPIWWEVVQKEKSYKYQKKTDFKELLEKEPQLQNPLSAFCFLRLQEWEVGDSITVTVFSHGENYPIKVQAVSKEPLNIYGKTFNTILLDVAVENVKIDISSAKLKDFKIWLTDDEMKLPIFMKANTSAGVVTVLLDNRGEFLKEGV